jgi:hypothetical protein
MDDPETDPDALELARKMEESPDPRAVLEAYAAKEKAERFDILFGEPAEGIQ